MSKNSTVHCFSIETWVTAWSIAGMWNVAKREQVVFGQVMHRVELKVVDGKRLFVVQSGAGLIGAMCSRLFLVWYLSTQ